MLDKKFSVRFKKDLKRFEHRKEVLKILNEVLGILLSQRKLPEKYKDHELTGSYISYRECHLKPDALLVYKVRDQLLYLYRIGSHSDLFN